MLHIKNRYFYVDYENVGVNGLNGIAKLSETDNVLIYYSGEHSTMTIGMHRRINQSQANIQFVLINMPIKNAIDCKILFDIELLSKENKLSEFFIVSNDTDYDKPIKLFTNNKIQIKRITELCKYNQPEPIIPTEKTDKISEKSNKITKREEEVMKFCDQNLKEKIFTDKKKEIITVLLTSKTKNAVNKGFSKIYPTSGIHVSKLHKILKPLIKDMPAR